MQPLSCSTEFVLAMHLCLHDTHSCKDITRYALNAGMRQRVADAIMHTQRPRPTLRVLPARQAVALL